MLELFGKTLWGFNFIVLISVVYITIKDQLFSLKSNQLKDFLIFLSLLIMGTWAFYQLSEIKSRYLFQLLPVLIIYTLLFFDTIRTPSLWKRLFKRLGFSCTKDNVDR